MKQFEESFLFKMFAHQQENNFGYSSPNFILNPISMQI